MCVCVCVCVCVDVNEYCVSSLFVCVRLRSLEESIDNDEDDDRCADVRRNGTREEVHAAMAARRAAKL